MPPAIEAVVQGQWQVGSRLKLEGAERAEPLVVGDVVVTAGVQKLLPGQKVRVMQASAG